MPEGIGKRLLENRFPLKPRGAGRRMRKIRVESTSGSIPSFGLPFQLGVARWQQSHSPHLKDTAGYSVLVSGTGVQRDIFMPKITGVKLGPFSLGFATSNTK